MSDPRKQWNDGGDFYRPLDHEGAPRIARQHLCEGGGGFLGTGIDIGGLLGGIGGGLGGSFLGDLLGVALAPETGGLSLALGPIAGGALGGFGGGALGDVVTGQPFKPLQDAAFAAGGGLAGALGVGGDIAGAFGSSAADLSAGFGSDAGFAGAVGSDIVPGGAAGAGAGIAADAAPITSSVAAGASPASLADPFQIASSGGAAAGTPGSAAGGIDATLVSQGAGPGGVTSATAFPPSVNNAFDAAYTAQTGVALPPPTYLGTSTAGDLSGAQAGLLPGGAPSAANLGGISTGGGVTNPFSALGDFWSANKGWLGPAAIAAPLVSQIMRSSQPQGGDPYAAERQQILNQLLQQSQQLNSGQLSPQQQQQFQNDLQAHLSAIDSHYASLGMTNSTAHLQERAAAQALGTGSQAATSQQLVSQGLAATGMAGTQAAQLAKEQLASDEALQQAIAAFAAASTGIGA